MRVDRLVSRGRVVIQYEDVFPHGIIDFPVERVDEGIKGGKKNREEKCAAKDGIPRGIQCFQNHGGICE